MITTALIALGVIMISSALYAVHAKNLVSAIIASGVISLMASIMYVLLAAPDVAMTEAAIGSGLTTVVFLLALSRIQSVDKKGNKNNA